VKACGLIVEYNPFHYGHVHHIQAAKEKSGANIIIAVMSGSFLQRGEPAIIDKFHRTRAALNSGVDIVLELPYPFALQSSELFAKGAVDTLAQIGVDSICFGSEMGKANPFIQAAYKLQTTKETFDDVIRTYLDQGYSFPQASNKAYDEIGIHHLDMTKPNNILGLSYTKTMMQDDYSHIEPLTIPRIHNEYHQEKIQHSIASATSIRKELHTNGLTEKALSTLPKQSVDQLQHYKKTANIWHQWELYFPFLHYKVMTMEKQQLASIFSVDEGLENRIKQTASTATSFADWLEKIKTKRYTQTRLQRMFVHILTNTSKEEMYQQIHTDSVPYLRLLGMSKQGRAYINKYKKHISIPIITNLKKDQIHEMMLDERATHIYYTILYPEKRIILRKQEFTGPIFSSDYP